MKSTKERQVSFGPVARFALTAADSCFGGPLTKEECVVTVQLESGFARRMELARGLGPLLNAEAEAGAAGGELTAVVVKSLLDGGFMNMGVSVEAGGEQLSYREWASVVEELARADSAAGWSVMATSSHAAAFSSVLPDEGIEALYAGGPPVIAGMPAPRGRAERVEGGYSFTGKHQFASGSMMADHFVAGGIVFEDGQMMMAENGAPRMVAVIVPRSQVRELGNWDVLGLEGTASIDYEIGPLFVPDARIVQVNPWLPKVLRGTTFWAVGIDILGPLGHGGPVLGTARRALEEIALLAPTRQRRDGPYAPVGDQPHFQYELARLDAALQGARLLYFDLINDLDEWSSTHDSVASRELAGKAKQVLRYVHDVCVQCVDFAFQYAGSAGIRKGHAIGRAFKNVHAMNQHIVVDPHNYIDAEPTVVHRLSAGAADFIQD